MSFDIPKKISPAVSVENITKLYGKENNNIIRTSLNASTFNQTNLNSKKCNQQADSSVTQTTQNSKPTIKRKRVNGGGISLIKGQKWNINGNNGKIPAKINICLGWDSDNSDFEIDASAFMLAQNGKVSDDSCFIFYGQKKSPDNNIIYKSNNENPKLPDDAEFKINLINISRNIQKIIICLTIYEAFERNLDFSMTKNLYARITDENGTELAIYRTDSLSSDVTSLVVGELYRYKDSWKFCAVGSGFRRDLAGFCNIYGVELE